MNSHTAIDDFGLPLDFFNSIPGGFHICEDDPENGYPFVYMADHFLNILGWTREEIAEKFENKYSKMVHPDDIEIAHGIQSGNGSTTNPMEDDRIFRMFGRHGYVYVSGNARRCSYGGKNYVQGVHNSITAFVKNEEKEKRALKTLEVRNRNDQAEIIRAISKVFYCIYYIDMSDYSYFDLGKTTLELDDLVGTKGNAVTAFPEVGKFLIHSDYYDKFVEYTNVKTLDERLRGKTWISEQFLGLNAGWSEGLFIASDRNEDGSLKHVVWAVRSINEQKQIELAYQKELEEMATIAQSANLAKSRFLSNMSHDIRTPMNAIIGFTALGAKYVNDPEKMTEYLGKIAVSGNHLLSLINDILDMSRIESGKVKIEENEVHLPDVLHDLRTIVQSDIAAKNIDLFVDTLDIRNEDVICDKLRLNQILLNLMSNAIKYTNAGGAVSLRVQQKPCNKQDRVLFEFHIKDTGIGMDPDFLKVVFLPFERMHSSTVSGIQGTGLGLSITKNLVEMMGGTISVESEEGKGSEFTVSLPFKKSLTPVIYETIPELQGVRVLVADDSADTCFSVSRMLTEIGMRSDWTTSGKEAVVRAKYAIEENDEYGAYIIDWLMPDMNGIETVRRIRRFISKDKPIIILTAYDWAPIEAEAREAGVTSFCSKPLFMSELRGALTKTRTQKGPEERAFARCGFTGKKVLLVEDNELNREIATEILSEIGFTVDTADDGDVAVERLKNASDDQYDVVLMDIQMPKLDGYTATREIRTLDNPVIANIPIIAMTANAFEEDKRNAFEAGMNGHIAKPIVVEKLERILLDALQR